MPRNRVRRDAIAKQHEHLAGHREEVTEEE
jgi:hypothetical protein